MKIYMEAKPQPWITWDKDLWKVRDRWSTTRFDDFIITSVKSEADVIMFEYYQGLMPFSFHPDKKYVIYIESLSLSDLADFIIYMKPLVAEGFDVTYISDSVEIVDKLPNCIRWNRPTRVSPRMEYNADDVDMTAKDGGFVITCNAERTEDNLTEILKTYFAMCLKDDPENEGELELMQDVDIYSAQELSFETFNNIRFNGLQPNPAMFKKIKRSKLFISPYRGYGVPINAIDALMLGTPVIVRDTVSNRAVFNWDEKCFYRNEEDLAKKIKFFSDIDVSDPEYLKIVNDGYNAINQSHSALNSLNSLIYILQEA